MKLKDLKPNDKFKSDSGVEFQLMPLTESDKRYLSRNKLTDRYKCKHLKSGEIFFLTDMIITKLCKK